MHARNTDAAEIRKGLIGSGRASPACENVGVLESLAGACLRIGQHGMCCVADELLHPHFNLCSRKRVKSPI